MLKLSKIIKLIRINNNLGQAKLANVLGVTKTYISLLENNKKEPSLALLKTFSKKFKIPLWLLVLDDSDFAENPSSADRQIKRELEALVKTYFFEKISTPHDLQVTV